MEVRVAFIREGLSSGERIQTEARVGQQSPNVPQTFGGPVDLGEKAR